MWAAGVTYAWSREARVREAVSKEIYVKVYEAERPELFFKALPGKVAGPNDWVGIRGDSRWNVPEPELALLINPALGSLIRLIQTPLVLPINFCQGEELCSLINEISAPVLLVR